MCRGKDDRPRRPDQPRQSVCCDINYGIRLTELSQVEALVKNVSNEVAKKLTNAKLSARNVSAASSFARIFHSLPNKEGSDLSCRLCQRAREA